MAGIPHQQRINHRTVEGCPQDGEGVADRVAIQRAFRVIVARQIDQLIDPLAHQVTRQLAQTDAPDAQWLDLIVERLQVAFARIRTNSLALLNPALDPGRDGRVLCLRLALRLQRINELALEGNGCRDGGRLAPGRVRPGWRSRQRRACSPTSVAQ